MRRYLLLCLLPLSLWAAPKSGYHYLSPETRTMQDDEFGNPGMLWVEQGRELFLAKGEEGESCATCHGLEGEKLDTQRIASFPRYNKDRLKPVTLRDQIHICWEDRLENFPIVFNDKRALYLETFVRYLARGERVKVDISGPMAPFYEAGKKLYFTRFGQMGMACFHCHDLYPGRKIRDQVLSEGQSNGFPVYRLGSGRLTSLGDRLNECFISLRAESFNRDSDEFRNLEVYLHARGNGLEIETPAVRY